MTDSLLLEIQSLLAKMIATLASGSILADDLKKLFTLFKTDGLCKVLT